jgi:hypothetical protein
MTRSLWHPPAVSAFPLAFGVILDNRLHAFPSNVPGPGMYIPDIQCDRMWTSIEFGRAVTLLHEARHE